MLSEIGHEVIISGPDERVESEMLIALHGGRCHSTVVDFRKSNPNGKIIVAMTGTDIYPEPDEKVVEAMALADRIVVLQSRALQKIPPEFRHKSVVIVQSTEVLAPIRNLDPHYFDICVVGHFRDVKDPLRAQLAARQLPAESKIRIRHAGGILERKYEELISQAEAENPRYEWLGEIDEQGVAQLLASSRAMILSSYAEGGARVIGEAVAHGTPVLSSEIDAAIGLLGEDYPAFYPAGDTTALANLMYETESNTNFYELLKQRTTAVASQFLPEKEKSSWRELIAGI